MEGWPITARASPPEPLPHEPEMNPFRMTRAALAACALLSVPALAQVAAYHDVDGAAHQIQFDTLSNSGYRPIALTAYGTTGSPLYAAVWVHRAGPNFIGFHGLTSGEYQALLAANQATHAPTILTARGTGGDARFAGVLEATGYAAYARHNVTLEQLKTEVSAAYDNGWKIATVDVYGSAADPRYVAAFEPIVGFEGWGWYRADGASDHQARFEAMTQSWVRPERVAFNDDSSKFVTLWSDTYVGQCIAHHDMTSAQYQALADQYWNQLGYYPVDVQASGSGNGRRFAAVWAATDRPLPRQWTTTGANPPELAAFDAWMQDYMQNNAIHGASLAIVKDHRLVLGKGYTWAPQGYPITQPTSLFRIASCNKPLTSIAIHQEIQKNPAQLDYGSSMASYFGNPAFTDTRCNDITVQHLLQHQGGWDRSDTGSNYDPMFIDSTVANSLGVPLPVSPTDIRTYMQGQMLDFSPGTDFEYSNYGFTLLGRILEARIPGQTFAQILQSRVFGPLGVTRPRVGRSHRADAFANEVLYHPRVYGISQSVNDVDRPWVASQYGGWNQPNMDAHGAYVMAAPDFAKVLAAFDLGVFNPLLGQTATTDMWTVANGANSLCRGWWKEVVSDGSGGTFDMFWHNGILQGTRAFIGRREDGLSFVVFANGDGGLGSGQGEQLSDLANTIRSWPTHDLFPSVGIPSFRVIDDLMAPFGTACPGSTATPSMRGTGSADIGGRLDFVLAGALPGTACVALVGTTRTTLDLGFAGAPGCTLYTPAVLFESTMATRSGDASVAMAIPADPALVDAHLIAQFAALDPRANGLGVVLTNGLDVRIGGWIGN